jgi:hypothetical protein
MANMVYHYLTQSAERTDYMSNMIRTQPELYKQYNDAYKQIIQMVTAHLATKSWKAEDGGAGIEWYRNGVHSGKKSEGTSDSDQVAKQVVRNLRANQAVFQRLMASNPYELETTLQRMITQISQNASHRVGKSPSAQPVTV